MPSYKTIKHPVTAEIEITRSRFITRLERVSDEAGAREVIAQVRAEHPKARHHCTAFVLGPDLRTRRHNDDGEPAGTAGAPMLEALLAAEVSDVVAVVTRYFGGVLLGAGGLTRAYRSAVATALKEATPQLRELRQSVTVTSGYELSAAIQHEARRRGFGLGSADYAETVTQQYLVPPSDTAGFTALVAELSAGSALVTAGDSEYVDL